MKTPSKKFYLEFSFKINIFRFSPKILDFSKNIFLKIFFSMMKTYFAFRFFSVIKYVYLVTPETIQNTRSVLTMTQKAVKLRPLPDFWRKLGKSIRCTPGKDLPKISGISSASLQMDRSRSSGGVGWSNGYWGTVLSHLSDNLDK